MSSFMGHTAIVLLLGGLLCARAERIYEEIQWSSEICAQMGHASDFDTCAVLEFCEGEDDDFGSRRRHLRHRQHGGGHAHKSMFRNHQKQQSQSAKPAAVKQEQDEAWGSQESFADQVPVAEAEEQGLEGMGHEEGSSEGSESQSYEMGGSVDSPLETVDQPPVVDWEQPPVVMSAEEGDGIDAGESIIEMDDEQETEQGSGDQYDPHSDSAYGIDGSEPNNARYGWRIPGSTHCSWPGPLIRLKRGQKHGIFVKGSGRDTPSNLHLHGMHVPGHGNADDSSRTVKYDDVIIYSIDVPEDKHMGGTHWYHTHKHGMSFEQIGGGAFGPLIVDDNGYDVGTQDEHVLSFLEKDRLLVLDNRSGDWIANGRNEGETYNFNKDEWYRLRVLSVSLDAHHSTEDISFGSECEVRAIAHDGIFRFQVPAEPRTSYTLNVASRLDVAIRCSTTSSIRVAGLDLVDIAVSSNPGADLLSTPFESGDQPWSSSRPAYLEDLRTMKVDNHWTVKVDTTNINGISMSDHTPLCTDHDSDFAYGSVQEWTLRRVNTHSLHVHVYPMQIVSETGCGTAHEVGEFYDTIFALNTASSDRCKVRLRMVDVAGPIMMHCHNLKHSDHGSMGYIMVNGGPTQPDEPRVQVCTSGSVCDRPHQWSMCGT